VDKQEPLYLCQEPERHDLTKSVSYLTVLCGSERWHTWLHSKAYYLMCSMNYLSYTVCVCNALCEASSQSGQKELVSVFMHSYDRV